VFEGRRLKKVINVFKKKVHPLRENPSYAYHALLPLITRMNYSSVITGLTKPYANIIFNKASHNSQLEISYDN